MSGSRGADHEAGLYEDKSALNQPPHPTAPPDWQRPRGVAAGTWQYVHQRAIARHYDDFVADTPLCQLDRRYVVERLDTLSTNTRPGFFKKSADSRPLVLDLGAGTGRLTRPIRELGYDVLAIDLSQSMLEVLLDNLMENESIDPSKGAVMPMRANLAQLDALGNSIADHAICMFSTIGMIQGRTNRIRFLTHVARAVRPAGTLIIHAHRRWAALREPGGFNRLLRSWIDSLRRGDAEFGDATYAYRGLDNMFMHRFTEREISSELEAAGWTVKRVDLVGLDGSELTKSVWNSSGMFLVCTRNPEVG